MMKIKRNRVLSFLLALLLVVNTIHLPVYADVEDTEESTICEHCQEEIKNSKHVYCTICKVCDCSIDHDATPSAPIKKRLEVEACKACGEEPCTCPDETEDSSGDEDEIEENNSEGFDVDAIWDRYDDYEDICMIGFVDENCKTLTFFGDAEEYVYTASNAKCPDYLVLYERFMEDGSDLFYRVDSLDMDFADEVTSIYTCLETKYFSEVVSLDEISVTVNQEDEIELYEDPYTSMESIYVDSRELSGEYLVEDFLYDYEYGWFIQLAPDEAWTEEIENYWIHSTSVKSLNRIANLDSDDTEKDVDENPLAIWEDIVTTNETLKIGFLKNTSKKDITFIAGDGEEGYYTASASNCPQYVIVEEEHLNEEGEALVYKVNSFDDDFREDVITEHSYLEEKYFSKVVEIEDIMAALVSDGLIGVSKMPEIKNATDAYYIEAENFGGEYAVEAFEYDREEVDNWFFKLVPDETWPEVVDEYLWVKSEYIKTLTTGSTEEPDEEELVYIETTDEVAGTTVTVCGNMPEGTKVSIKLVEIEESDDPDAPKIYGAFDIKLLDKDGNEWQPENGESLAVTLSTEGMQLENNQKVFLLHTHEDVTDELGVYIVEENAISFTVTSFSIITITELKENSAEVNGIIYLDLNAGNVTLDTNGYYTGYRFDGKDEGNNKYTGKIEDKQKFYVFQSFGSDARDTGIVEVDGVNVLKLPDYTNNRIPNWANIITDNSDVDAVIREWNKLAKENTANIADWSPRSATNNKITINPSDELNNISITIDNIWTQYYTSGLDNRGRQDGGISCHWVDTPEEVTIKFKGDNRMNNIYYRSEHNDSRLIFEGDSDATLTVCNMEAEKGYNFWCSAIGASDTGDTANGLVFKSGCVYAGTTEIDDCTAIGGGGNGFGRVIIEGTAIVTAVSHSSGTAIGGGIGKSDYGGEANIAIGGNSKVFAYNFSSGWTDGVIPAVAIGGGSSYAKNCKDTEITISGNSEVFAQTIGGTAIGGGSSSTKNGGGSNITIKDKAKVTAISISDYVSYYTDTGRTNHMKTETKYPAGASIGGGTGGTEGNGGDCTLTIQDEATVYTGSIGGGRKLNTDSQYHIGNATVTIDGGTLQGQVIMAAGAGDDCTFVMKNGEINNILAKSGSYKIVNDGTVLEFKQEIKKDDTKNIYKDKTITYTFLKENGNAVWIENGSATLSGGTIQNTKATQGGAIYVTGGSFEMDGTNAKITNASANENGGAVCVVTGDATIKKGQIEKVSAANGGAIAVSGGNFEMTGGSIGQFQAIASDNTGGNGGAIYVMDGTAKVGGIITGSNTITEAVKGGAVYVGGGNFEMTGGSITNCNASELGGAVCVQKTGSASSNAVLNGGTIENVSANNGGAVAVTGGAFEMNGGEISGVKATSDGTKIDGLGGAVYVENGSVTINDGTITGHISDPEAGSGGGVYIGGGSFEMTGGTMTNFNVTGNGGMVCVMDGSAEIQGGTISGNPEDGVNEAAKGGAVYVGGDESTKFTIHGSGHIKDCNATESGGGVYLDNGTFTVSGGTFENCTAATDGGGVYMGGGTFNMNGGMFESCTATSNGGGVYLGGGTFNMTNGTGAGGSISSCSAANGGGTYLAGGTLNMAGGSFNACKATNNGGAVCIMNGNANITDGKIEGDNTVDANDVITPNNLEAVNGGGIYVGGGELDMSNGTITRCSATSGGAAYITAGDCKMTGGTVSHNYAENGGGMYVLNTPVTYGNADTGLSDIAVLYNYASENGGGMYICQNSSSESIATTITRGRIENNTAVGNGGGIYHTGDKGTCTVSSTSSISSNTAKNGGGLYIIDGSALTVSGGHIAGNKAVKNSSGKLATAYVHSQNEGVGGGVYVGPGTSKPSTFIMDASTNAVGIYSNEADSAADDVYAYYDKTRLELPTVDNMLLGDGLTATGWYADYATKDIHYNNTTVLNASAFDPFKQEVIERYRDAQKSTTEPYVVSVNLIPTTGKYICLTIGSNIIKFGQIQLTANGSDDTKQYYVFQIKAVENTLENSALYPIEFEVAIKNGETITIDRVPFGEYIITEMDDWSWRYNVSSYSGNVWAYVEKQPVTDGTEKEYEWKQESFSGTGNVINNVRINYSEKPVELAFVNQIDTSVAYKNGSLWLDGNSESKINALKVNQTVANTASSWGRSKTLFWRKEDEM